MKNTLIHEGLEKSKIRDFLSTQLETSQLAIIALKPQTVPYIDLNSVIQNDKLQIEYLKKRILYHEQILAVLTLIETNGWKEFDVSDYVDKDFSTGWLSFIGTEEEHKALINKIETNNG